MSTEIIITILVATLAIGLVQLLKFRRAFLVSEGHAGLLYHKGKFVEVLLAGEHVRWGRKFTLGVADLRKTSLVVAGQEILTADNVNLKASLFITLQVSDVAKAAHRQTKIPGGIPRRSDHFRDATPVPVRTSQAWPRRFNSAFASRCLGLQALQRCSGFLNRRARGSTVATHQPFAHARGRAHAAARTPPAPTRASPAG